MKRNTLVARFGALALVVALSAGCEGAAGTGVIGIDGSGLGPGGDGDGGSAAACSTVTGNEKIACLANALKASLPSSQQSLLQLQYSVDNAKRWSYFPCSNSCRNGVRFQDLTSPQLTTALALARAALEPQGYTVFDGVRTADFVLAQQRAGYGGLLYNVAFIGSPSSVTPWQLQLNGNNYAVNLRISSGVVAGITPYAVGSEPQSFAANGGTYAPMQGKKTAMFAMINSLDATQRAQAQLVGASFDDLLLGPGQDDMFPFVPQGVVVSSLTASQQALVKAAMEAWVNDAPAAVAAEADSAYEDDSTLTHTYVSWATSTDSTVSGSYVRIDGPRVWIELLGQRGDVFTNEIRFRSIWRDQWMDYGELGP